MMFVENYKDISLATAWLVEYHCNRYHPISRFWEGKREHHIWIEGVVNPSANQFRAILELSRKKVRYDRVVPDEMGIKPFLRHLTVSSGIAIWQLDICFLQYPVQIFSKQL